MSLAALERELRLAEAAIAPGRFDETSSTFGSADYDQAKAQFGSRISAALDDHARGRLDARGLEDRLQRAIKDAYPAAYQDGAARWGRADLGAADQAWLRRAVAGEAGFARNFAQAIGRGDVSPAQAAVRASLYVDALDSVRTNGWVEAAPDGTVFDWVLNASKHCGDCILIASESPYTKEDLPTVPRGGDTACLSRCYCSLIIRSHGAAPPKATLRNPDAAHGTTNQGREPNTAEQAQIDELRGQVNYWRRQAADADNAEAQRAAFGARRDANAALIDLIQSRGLREIPLLSVGEVLTTRDVRPDVVEQILERGLDGPTLAQLDDAAFSHGMKALLHAYKSYLKPKP